VAFSRKTKKQRHWDLKRLRAERDNFQSFEGFGEGGDNDSTEDHSTREEWSSLNKREATLQGSVAGTEEENRGK
jgi:hypothetical protein